MMEKWQVAEIDVQKVREFSQALNIKPLLARLMLARGIKTLRDADCYINPDLINLHNPFLMPDMGKCVERLKSAISQNEKILIYGDRDVDGITSITLLHKTLKMLGAQNLFWYIPSTEGYGLNKDVIEKYKKEHSIDLLITVDCGITNIEEIAFAYSLGIEVIVTDHHEPSEKSPICEAVVNPKVPGSVYPFRDLAGCAVVYKIMHALLFSYSPYYNQEFVALDIETTGLEPQLSEICELGAVRTKNALILESFQSLVKTSRPIPPEVSSIHGITNEMCRTAPELSSVLKKLKEFIGEKKLLIHNAPFDLAFLRHAFKSSLGLRLSNDYIDTLQLSRAHFPFKSHALTSLVRDLKMDIDEHHRALSDAKACAMVFWRLQEMTDVRIRYFLEEHMDLLTIGTLADVMPLISENRTIVKRGIEGLMNTKKPGLRKILDEALAQKNTNFIGSKYISWNVTPLLNAAGRMGKADVACNLLMSSHAHESDELYKELSLLNINRKELQEVNFSRFMELLESQCDVQKDSVLIVHSDDVEHGVTGVVASDIVRRFKKPVVLFVVKDGIAQGSGRAPNGFDLLGLVEKTGEILIKFGGHKGAVGLSIKQDALDEFRKKIEGYAAELEMTIPDAVIQIDAAINEKEIKPEILRDLRLLEPFGPDNPAPVFLIRGLGVVGHSRVGVDGAHLRMKFAKNGANLSAIGWGMGELDRTISEGDTVDVAAQLESNLWQEREYVQLSMISFRKSEV